MKRYAKEIMDFIEKNVVGTTTKDLVKLVNSKFSTDFTESKMKSYKSNNKLKSGTRLGLPAGRPTELYPEYIKTFITEHYIGVGPKDMTELLNKSFETNYTVAQMKSYYGNNNINSGTDGRFAKGHIPANKGLIGVGGWEPTQFKKGNVPVNYRPIGSERVNVYGYVEIKVADPNKWRLKHQVIWEEANGHIPKGHVVIFGDRNTDNLDPKNLILVSKSQLLIMNKNRLIQNDADLTRTGIAIADLYQKISKRKGKAK